MIKITNAPLKLTCFTTFLKDFGFVLSFIAPPVSFALLFIYNTINEEATPFTNEDFILGLAPLLALIIKFGINHMAVNPSSCINGFTTGLAHTVLALYVFSIVGFFYSSAVIVDDPENQLIMLIQTETTLFLLSGFGAVLISISALMAADQVVTTQPQIRSVPVPETQQYYSLPLVQVQDASHLI